MEGSNYWRYSYKIRHSYLRSQLITWRRPELKFGRNVVRKTTKNYQDEDKSPQWKNEKLILGLRSLISKGFPIKTRKFVIFWPGQKCHSKVMHWKEVVHSNGSYERKLHGLKLADEMGRAKKFPWYTHRLMHRKWVTCELHDSYFRLMTIKHSISKIEWAIEWASNDYITQLSSSPRAVASWFEDRTEL